MTPLIVILCLSMSFYVYKQKDVLLINVGREKNKKKITKAKNGKRNINYVKKSLPLTCLRRVI